MTFLHHQKMFPKITMKIDIVETCINFQLSHIQTMVF
jgi:hypothetical protein